MGQGHRPFGLARHSQNPLPHKDKGNLTSPQRRSPRQLRRGLQNARERGALLIRGTPDATRQKRADPEHVPIGSIFSRFGVKSSCLVLTGGADATGAESFTPCGCALLRPFPAGRRDHHGPPNPVSDRSLMKKSWICRMPFRTGGDTACVPPLQPPVLQVCCVRPESFEASGDPRTFPSACPVFRSNPHPRLSFRLDGGSASL